MSNENLKYLEAVLAKIREMYEANLLFSGNYLTKDGDKIVQGIVDRIGADNLHGLDSENIGGIDYYFLKINNYDPFIVSLSELIRKEQIDWRIVEDLLDYLARLNKYEKLFIKADLIGNPIYMSRKGSDALRVIHNELEIEFLKLNVTVTVSGCEGLEYYKIDEEDFDHFVFALRGLINEAKVVETSSWLVNREGALEAYSQLGILVNNSLDIFSLRNTDPMSVDTSREAQKYIAVIISYAGIKNELDPGILEPMFDEVGDLYTILSRLPVDDFKKNLHTILEKFEQCFEPDILPKVICTISDRQVYLYEFIINKTGLNN